MRVYAPADASLPSVTCTAKAFRAPPLPCCSLAAAHLHAPRRLPTAANYFVDDHKELLAILEDLCGIDPEPPVSALDQALPPPHLQLPQSPLALEDRWGHEAE